MNRLTKRISLVLIPSSLLLHGCEGPEEPNPTQNDPQATSSDTPVDSSGRYGGYHGGHSAGSWWWSTGRTATRPSFNGGMGAPGFHGGAGSSVHAGGSARGGFGGSAHGGGS